MMLFGEIICLILETTGRNPRTQKYQKLWLNIEMNRIIRSLVGVLVVLSFNACNADNHAHQTAITYFNSIEQNESVDQNLRNLLEMTNSREFWEQFYGLFYIGELLSAPNIQDKTVLVDALRKGMSSPHKEIVDISVKAFRSAPKGLLKSVVSELVVIVKSGADESITWAAIEALGNTENENDKILAAKTISECARQHANDKVPLGTLNINIFAARALGQIGLQNQDVSKVLGILLQSENYEIALAASEAMLILNSQDEIAGKRIQELSLLQNLIGEQAKIIQKKMRQE